MCIKRQNFHLSKHLMLYAHMHRWRCTNTHTHTCTCTHTTSESTLCYMRTCIHRSTHTNTHTYAHAYTHEHTYICTCVHTRTHIHMHMRTHHVSMYNTLNTPRRQVHECTKYVQTILIYINTKIFTYTFMQTHAHNTP